MKKTRKKKKGKVTKTRVAKWKWDSVLGLLKRARGVTTDSEGEEGVEPNNPCVDYLFSLKIANLM